MKPPQYRENTITRYRLVEEHLVGEGKEPVRNYDLLSIIMLCLGGPNGANYDGVLRMLDVFSPAKPARRRSGRFCRTITTFK